MPHGSDCQRRVPGTAELLGGPNLDLLPGADQGDFVMTRDRTGASQRGEEPRIDAQVQRLTGDFPPPE